MDTAGNEEISCALGSGADEDRRFDLYKAVLVEVVTGDLADLVTHDNVALEIGTAKVEIAVFKPCKL